MPKMFYPILLVALSSVNWGSCFNPKLINHLSYNISHSFVVNRSVEYILEFDSIDTPYPPRISIYADANKTNPLMVVARQPRELLSWELPLIIESESGLKQFYNMSRTLCHDPRMGKRWLDEEEGEEVSVLKHDSPVVTVSTASRTNVPFTIRVDYQEDFIVEPSVTINFAISPSEPRYYFYDFKNNISDSRNSNYDTVILEVNSEDSVCMTVSIQNASCPVFDSNQDITFRGFYETVSKKGGITIPKYKFPYGFFIVFVAKGDDYDCTRREGMSVLDRQKKISFTIKPSITYSDYVFAVLVTLGAIGAFYVIFALGFFLCSRKLNKPREMDYVHSQACTPTTPGAVVVIMQVDDSPDNISVNEAEYDVVEEADRVREIRLGKSTVYVSDLARKDPKIILQKSYLYLYNVLTVAIFYGLPVVQLVITYQNVLNQTGQQDLCYYNFLCAHPFGVISDFNHLFSNIGYVLFGILFLYIVYRRQSTHKDIAFERQYGIPTHYGLFYAMGVSLIMEGILSGSYHICPNTSNFQFDSSFMYVMSVLCVVKLYQNRHPDINATAYSTFGVLAVAIFLGLIGILENNLYFWGIFTVIHILTCLYLSIQIYYMGCWKLDTGLVLRTYRAVINDYNSGPINLIKPTYKGRMCLLIVGNICNWTVATFGFIHHQKDFAIYLLGIFMMNTLLYFFFYIIMKVIHRETVTCLPVCFLLISLFCAASAMWFFLHRSISWAKTPAESRLYNQECKLLRFYDYHDIWHFLSAIGMFFTFMVLLTLDDDLSHTARTQIRVF